MIVKSHDPSIYLCDLYVAMLLRLAPITLFMTVKDAVYIYISHDYLLGVYHVNKVVCVYILYLLILTGCCILPAIAKMK